MESNHIYHAVASDNQRDEMMCFQSDILTVSLWESMLRQCFEDEGSKSVWE